MNAGTKEAILDIVSLNPTHTHLLLWGSRNDAPGPTSIELAKNFDANNYWVRKNLFDEIRFMKKAISELEPDVIHLHSSRAGALGRVFIRKYQLIYTSHGFGFQRNDVGWLKKNIFFYIEKILSKKSYIHAAIWPSEYQIAVHELKVKQVIFYPPSVMRNFLNPNHFSTYSQKREKEVSLFVIGRLTPAKDPKFAIETQKYISKISKYRIKWIGCSESNQSLIRDILIKNGLMVSHWIPREVLYHSIKDSAVVLVTSSWEAGPLVFYESLLNGIPIVTRPILPFKLLGIECFDNPKDFAAQAVKLANSRKERENTISQQIKFVRQYLDREFRDQELYFNEQK